MSGFATRLKIAMEKADKSAAELARATGMSEGTISRYLSGQIEPKMKSVFILAAHLNTSADYLSGNTDKYEIRISNDEMAEIYSALSLSGKQKVLDYAEYVLTQEKKNV